MSERNLERASFLKSRRQRLTPEQVGLAPSPRRRVTTLRREDVAWLADVGITWYTWLEQGRPIKIAAGTLARIAAVLRLDDSETEYLQKLVHTDCTERPSWDAPVADRYRSLVASYTPGYAFVMGPRWDILTWNERFGDLFGLGIDLDRTDASLDRNALWRMFTHPRPRYMFPDWNEIARRMVATFRAEYADYVGDHGFADLIDALKSTSQEFAVMWADDDVLSPTRWSVGETRDPQSKRSVAFETVSLAIAGSPGQTLVFCIPTRSLLAAILTV